MRKLTAAQQNQADAIDQGILTFIRDMCPNRLTYGISNIDDDETHDAIKAALTNLYVNKMGVCTAQEFYPHIDFAADRAKYRRIFDGIRNAERFIANIETSNRDQVNAVSERCEELLEIKQFVYDLLEEEYENA